MLTIKVNGKQLKKLKHFKNIKTISITTSSHSVIIPKEDARAIATYIYEATQRCVGTIMYNNTIIQKQDVKEIKWV